LSAARARLAALSVAAAIGGITTAVAGAPAALVPYERLARSPAAPRLLAVARSAMLAHWDSASAAPDTSRIPDWPGEPVALYVTLADGPRTRACVGTPAPMRGSLVETIRALAVQALAADPRHPPLRRDELDRLRVAIAFADQGEAIADPMRVDPGREGLLVSGPRGSIAYLPGEARTVRWALTEARRSGLLAGAAPTYRRFHAVVIAESPTRSTPESTDDPD